MFTVVHAEPRSREWHDLRAEGISASDVAVVMDRSTYGSRFDLWYTKLYADGWETDDDQDGDYAYWGNVFEPAIRGWFAKRHPEFYVDDDPGTCIHETEPWRRCNPDGLVYEGPYKAQKDMIPVAGLECKNVDRMMAERWGDERFQGIAQNYYDQVQWCMDVTGLTTWFVAALFGGNTPVEYEVTYDPAYAAVLREECGDFWQSILDGVQPEPDGHPATLRRLYRMFPTRVDETVTVPDDLAAEFRTAAELKTSATRAYDAAKARLFAAIGEGRWAVDGDGEKVATRSVYPQERIDGERLRDEQPQIAADYVKKTMVHKLTPAKRKASK